MLFGPNQEPMTWCQ